MSTTWNDSRFGPGSYEFAAQEDRSAPRLRVHMAAMLRASGVEPIATIVHDLSLGGTTVTAPRRLDPHTLCWLSIAGFAPIHGEVVWYEAGMVGIAFLHLIDHDVLAAMAARHGTRGPGIDA